MMFIKLRRWFFTKLEELEQWTFVHDLCEICKENHVEAVCVGCKGRICCDCNSFYYEDETLCMVCRKQITSEEEAQDRADMADFYADAEG